MAIDVMCMTVPAHMAIVVMCVCVTVPVHNTCGNCSFVVMCVCLCDSVYTHGNCCDVFV